MYPLPSSGATDHCQREQSLPRDLTVRLSSAEYNSPRNYQLLRYPERPTPEMMTPLSRDNRARYTAWTNGQSLDFVSPEELLDGLADSILADGVESSLTKALHHGFSREGEPPTPGLDNLRDRLRAEERSAVSDLAAQIDDDALSDVLAGTTDDTLRRMISALRTRSTSLIGSLSGASPEARAAFGSLLEASAPADNTQAIPDRLDGLVELARLERQLRSLRSVQEVNVVDLELLERLLGQDAGNAFRQLIGSLQAFTESGYVQSRDSRAVLSSRAVQKIGDTLLQATLNRLESRAAGQHFWSERGHSHQPAGASRDYEFGDPFELDLGQSILGAVKRGGKTPVKLDVSDLKVLDRETSERATTILAVDLSRSMGERGYLLATKRLALTLTTFIRTRYPHDELLLIGFSESARQVNLQELVELQWDRYGVGTNVQDALRLATGILNSHRGRRRNVVLITDGEPTAHRDTTGQVVFNHPPSDETVARTFREAHRLRRDGVYLCVCVMSTQQQVTTFGRELAKQAAGDALVTDPDNLGADLVITYSRRRH